ncbi:MAG TPA: UDP-N-acetylmuramate--L-alanine ligase [Kofleriaceae bacterium]|nr:UDP-N-acetylmuramate--L-alanine ligase [Kofleriaceae bacterium]
MKVHFIGIGGTGMGAVAGLLAAAGHEVRGSDTAVYPPMSDQLAALGIPVFEGFAAANLEWHPDVVVVGNVNSRDHVEVLAAQERGIPLTSFPAVLGEQLLAGRHSIVVAGTHGKTTTTSLVAHILMEAGRDPGLFVGGVPIALGQGWYLGKGEEFVVEGDEYDTAFFDKGSKFLHYRPRTAILTSVELDHVDIFASFEQVREAFRKFVVTLPTDGLLVVCQDQAEALAVAQAARCKVETYAVADDGAEQVAGATWCASDLAYQKTGRMAFDLTGRGQDLGRFETLLAGRHNVANVVAAIAVALDRGVQVEIVRRAVSSFAGVRRRQEVRGIARGVWVLDDYAHHPTAVRETLKALRRRFPKRHLIAAYEPRSATSRRRTFQDEFARAFAHADLVVVGRLFDPTRIPKEERFDPERLALDLHQAGTQAAYVPDVDAMVKQVAAAAGPGDVVVALSSGSFDGFHDKLLDELGDAVVPARRVDMAAVRAMLAAVELPADESADDRFGSCWVLRNEHGLVGTVGLDVLGDDAILRSLAVTPAVRGHGYGWILADIAVQWARFRGCQRIYLLTAHASEFFAVKLGFRVVERSTVSPAVAETPTFQGSTDSKFVAMRLDL